MTKKNIVARQPVVLIVDDQQSIRTALCDLLAISFPKARVLEACNGAMAFAAIIEARPTLVLMDVFLPDANGIEITGRIKALACETVIIVMSTDNSVRTKELAITAGATQFIEKDRIFEQLEPLLLRLNLMD